MSTLPESREPNQALKRKRIHVFVEEESFRRLRVHAAKVGKPMGTVLSQLLMENLPSVEAAA